MTRRLFAAVTIATVLGGFGASAADANNHDYRFCVGFDDQNNPGYIQAICIHEVIQKG